MLDQPKLNSMLQDRDPARQSQHSFRGIMNALARPGTEHMVATVDAPRGLDPAAASVIAALCDYETPLWLGTTCSVLPDVGAWITFHTGAPRVADPRLAAFAVLDLATDELDLSVFAQGSAEYPDRSTTIIAVTPSLESGRARRIAGPGIKGETQLLVAGLPDDFAEQWALNGKGFPLGVDMVFCADGKVVGLPRSTRIIGEAV
jgi:alpha-D-ribose 1-methylphosphonate 5-triphosphate synthase subunit PhnH